MKSIVLLSGGQDSTTCLYWALDRGREVETLSINYGQRHAAEIDAARHIARHVGVIHSVIDVPDVLAGMSPLVSNQPLEQYADSSALPGGVEKTFVPLRNQLFITLACNRALVVGAQEVIIGVCADDYEGYPDCRPQYIYELEHAMALGGAPVLVTTPLIDLTKREIVQLGAHLPGCYEMLAYTLTSYDGAYPPIGHDHATLLRQKGFADAGLPDPLVLRAVAEGLMERPNLPGY